MQAYLAHLKNKYPQGRVECREDSIDAYDHKGEHRVALRKNGAGQWSDVGAMVGASDAFSLDPIPKASRVWKHYSKNGDNGRVALSEESESRKESLVKYLDKSGRVKSIPELQAEGIQFDSYGDEREVRQDVKKV